MIVLESGNVAPSVASSIAPRPFRYGTKTLLRFLAIAAGASLSLASISKAEELSKAAAD